MAGTLWTRTRLISSGTYQGSWRKTIAPARVPSPASGCTAPCHKGRPPGRIIRLRTIIHAEVDRVDSVLLDQGHEDRREDKEGRRGVDEAADQEQEEIDDNQEHERARHHAPIQLTIGVCHLDTGEYPAIRPDWPRRWNRMMAVSSIDSRSTRVKPAQVSVR